jgi:hypothetical protein
MLSALLYALHPAPRQSPPPPSSVPCPPSASITRRAAEYIYMYHLQIGGPASGDLPAGYALSALQIRPPAYAYIACCLLPVGHFAAICINQARRLRLRRRRLLWLVSARC